MGDRKVNFKIISLNISEHKGEIKHPVEKAIFQEDKGILGDAHAGKWHRQVSLLGEEAVRSMMKLFEKGGIEYKPGIFAENITTLGVEWEKVPVGTRVYLGESVILEITQIGKECHHGCEIFKKVGSCVMPKKGVFARVMQGGEVTSEDTGYYYI